MSLLFAGGAILILIVFANLRGLQTAQKLEATTSIALAVVYLLGLLVGLLETGFERDFLLVGWQFRQ